MATVREIVEVEPEEGTDQVELENRTLVKKILIRNSTGVTWFLPYDPVENYQPGDSVAVDVESKTILYKLPTEHRSTVSSFQVVENPKDTLQDIGGLTTQIRELIEAIVLPLKEKDLFKKMGLAEVKGVILYGPPGTGKTLMARACASQSNATFFRLSGTQLAQRLLGEGAAMVRDMFNLAKEKSPAIVFIDEIDAIGKNRGCECSGRPDTTMLELLSQLDGFSTTKDIKVIAATNRIDVLDPALLRSGRFDKKIHFPLPDENSRLHIFRIHSHKLILDSRVDWEAIAKLTDGFNGAECIAVCMEAGMITARRHGECITQEDLEEAVQEIKLKGKKHKVATFLV